MKIKSCSHDVANFPFVNLIVLSSLFYFISVCCGRSVSRYTVAHFCGFYDQL